MAQSSVLSSAVRVEPKKAERELAAKGCSCCAGPEPFVARLLDQCEIPSERLPHSRHRRLQTRAPDAKEAASVTRTASIHICDQRARRDSNPEPSDP